MKLLTKTLALLLAVAGCSRSMPVIPSPGGTFTLITLIPQKRDDPDFGYLVFEIRDATGALAGGSTLQFHIPRRLPAASG
jgi:hypothetical protein